MTDKEQLWNDYIEDLTEYVWRSRWNGRSVKGSDHDAIQSAIKSALAKEECPPIEDPGLYDFLEQNLKRKIDTYRHAYRNGEGKTIQFSQIGKDQNFPIDLLTKIQSDCPDQQMEFPPTGLSRNIAPELLEQYLIWLKAEIELIEPAELRAVANHWLDGYTLVETGHAIGVSASQVARARRTIKQRLRARAE